MISSSVQQTSSHPQNTPQKVWNRNGTLATATCFGVNFKTWFFSCTNLLHTANKVTLDTKQPGFRLHTMHKWTHHHGSSTCPNREKSVCRSKALTEAASPLTQRLHRGELCRRKERESQWQQQADVHQKPPNYLYLWSVENVLLNYYHMQQTAEQGSLPCKYSLWHSWTIAPTSSSLTPCLQRSHTPQWSWRCSDLPFLGVWICH